MTRPAYFPFRSPSARSAYLALYQERQRGWPVPFETRFVETPTGRTGHDLWYAQAEMVNQRILEFFAAPER